MIFEVSAIRTIAVLSAGLIGIVWIGQGLGFIPGSFMSGQIVWAVLGTGLLVVSAWLWRSGRRTPSV